MTEMVRPRLREGLIVRRLVFGGAFVIDAEGLAAVEIDDRLADLITGVAQPPTPLPPALVDEIRRGYADGWLTADQTAAGGSA